MDSDNGKHRCFQSRNVRPAPALCSRMLKDRLLTTCAILLQMGLNWNAVSRWRRFKTGQSSTARQPLADDIRYYIIFVFFCSRQPPAVSSLQPVLLTITIKRDDGRTFFLLRLFLRWEVTKSCIYFCCATKTSTRNNTVHYVQAWARSSQLNTLCLVICVTC